MDIKYNLTITNTIIVASLRRIINQIYKLLPLREENLDWQKPLETVIEELTGISDLLDIEPELFFMLLCKLQGLFSLTEADDYSLYRRIIFECLNICNNIKDVLEKEIR